MSVYRGSVQPDGLLFFRFSRERWRKDYNEFRPHCATLYLTLAELAQKSGLEAV